VQAKQSEVERLTATLSEMKSMTTAENSRLVTEANSQQSAHAAKLLQAEHALDSVRHELDNSQHATQRYAVWPGGSLATSSDAL